MQKIFKQTLELHRGEYDVEFPEGTKIVAVDNVDRELSIWGKFDTSALKEPWITIPICITFTGKKFDDMYNKHLKTVVLPEGVWHVLTTKGNGKSLAPTILDDVDGFGDSLRKGMQGGDVCKTIDEILNTIPSSKKTFTWPDMKTCKNGCDVKVHAMDMCRHCYDKWRRSDNRMNSITW